MSVMFDYKMPKDLPDYDDMALYEAHAAYVPNMMETCYAFYMPQQSENYTVYQQIVWPHEGGKHATVADVHLFIGESRVEEARRHLSKICGDDFQEVGKTRAFGHTLGVKRLSKNDDEALDKLVKAIKEKNTIIPFMSNVFETTTGSAALVNEMKYKIGKSEVALCLYNPDGYTGLKNLYLNKVFPNESKTYRDQTTDSLLKMFVSVFKNPADSEKIENKFMAYLDNEGDDPQVYAREVAKARKIGSLMKGTAY